MKGIAPRSADWLVLGRKAASGASVRTEPIYPGGLAFCDRKTDQSAANGPVRAYPAVTVCGVG